MLELRLTQGSFRNLVSFWPLKGVATGGVKGQQSAHLDSKKIAKTQEKEGENQEKMGKLGRFFHFAPPDR